MRILVCLSFLLLASCGQLSDVFKQSTAGPDPAEEPGAPTDVEIVDGVAAPVLSPSNETLVTLGNAAEAGLWVKTPLVSTAGAGRVTEVESGRTIEVTLLPIDGPPTAGSRASLAALQALGLPLTAVSAIVVETL